MHHRTPLKIKALGASFGALLVLSACGASDPSPTTDLSAAAADATAVATTDAVIPPSAQATVALPAVEVVDLATGQSLSLDNLAPTGPTLVWFWAPS